MACAESRRDRSSSPSASLDNFTEAEAWNSPQTHAHMCARMYRHTPTHVTISTLK